MLGEDGSGIQSDTMLRQKEGIVFSSPLYFTSYDTGAKKQDIDDLIIS